MKTVVSNELKSRLTNAAANGSRVAQDILTELKTGKPVEQVIKGTANYFSTQRLVSSSGATEKSKILKIVFTAFMKDKDNENFPDRNNRCAVWFTENRTKLKPSAFVECFRNLPEYSSEELEYFSSAICINSRIKITMHSDMNSIYEAYQENNYISICQNGDMPLHKSCMRDYDKARNAADFYANFAGAKILVARDDSNNVLGRAIAWEKVIWEKDGAKTIVSVLDRVYFSYTFVLHLIYNYAREKGIELRKTVNDYNHTLHFTALNNISALGIAEGDRVESNLKIKVPAIRWHKQGAPYLDTFCYLTVSNGEAYLVNYASDSIVATCRTTTGYADRSKYLCPVCGKLHEGDIICDACRRELFTDTPFGNLLIGKTIHYNGSTYPSIFFRKGRYPKETFQLYMKLDKLFVDNINQ